LLPKFKKKIVFNNVKKKNQVLPFSNGWCLVWFCRKGRGEEGVAHFGNKYLGLVKVENKYSGLHLLKNK